MNAESKAAAEAKGLDRRQFISRTAVAAIAVSGSALICASEAWGLEVKSLKPETMRTLIKMSRDIYPHDKLADKYYALATKGFDTAETKAMMEEGVAMLDAAANAAHGMPYASLPWESQRVALLKQIENGAFFQKVRSGLIVSLYNNEAVWPIFGYEGSSADKGGYIKRGFDDITWL